MLLSQDNSELVLSIYDKAVPDKKMVALSLQHLNEAAGNAAMVHTYFEGVIEECEDGDYKDSLLMDLRALWAGYYGSNSQGGRLLQDYRSNTHKIFDGTEKKTGGSFLSGLFGKKKENNGGQQ